MLQHIDLGPLTGALDLEAGMWGHKYPALASILSSTNRFPVAAAPREQQGGACLARG